MVLRVRSEDRVDDLVHALELVGIHQGRDIPAAQPLARGLLGLRGAAAAVGRFDAGERAQNGGERPFAAAGQIAIARQWNIGVAKLFEDLDDQRETVHGSVNFVRRLATRAERHFNFFHGGGKH